MLYCCASCSRFWSSIPARQSGFYSSAFFLSAFLLFKFPYACHLVLSALPVHSPRPSTNRCFLSLLSSASGITISLCALSNSLNNISWFDSNNRFCLYCFVLLSYRASILLLLISLLSLLLILLLIIIMIIIIIIICFVFNPFEKVCIVLYPLFSLLFMPQVKDQRSHSLHLILAYFIFVTIWLPVLVKLFLNFTIL